MVPSPDPTLLPRLLVGTLLAATVLGATGPIVRLHGGVWPPRETKVPLARWDFALGGGLALWLSAIPSPSMLQCLAVLLLWIAARTDGPTGLIPSGLLYAGFGAVALLAVVGGRPGLVVGGMVAGYAYMWLGRLVTKMSTARQGKGSSLGDADPWLLGIVVAGLGADGLGAFWVGNVASLCFLTVTRNEGKTHLAPWLVLGVVFMAMLNSSFPSIASFFRMGL